MDSSTQSKYRNVRALFLFIAIFLPLCGADTPLPDCAKPCYSSFPSQCNNEPKCVCTDPQWTSSLSCCTKEACSSRDYQSALLNWNDFCAPAGISINPDLDACPSASASSRSSTRISSSSSSSTTSSTSTTSTTSSTTSTTSSKSSSTPPSTSSSTTSTASASTQSSTSSDPTSSPSTAPASTSPSPSSSPSQSGLSSSSKVGIGLGVPLGVCAVALLALLLFRHMRHKDSSRLHHSGNIAAAGLYPAQDNFIPSAEKGTVGAVAPAIEHSERQPLGELHQEPVPPFSREVEGSPGPDRGELG